MSPLLAKRLDALEAAIERLAAAGPRGDDLIMRDPATLTAAECVDAWRRLCQRPPGAPYPRAHSGDELEEILEQWRELTS